MAAWPDRGAVGAGVETTPSVPAGVHWMASLPPPPKVCPYGDLTGPGRDLAWMEGVFTVLALGPGGNANNKSSILGSIHCDKPFI